MSTTRKQSTALLLKVERLEGNQNEIASVRYELLCTRDSISVRKCDAFFRRIDLTPISFYSQATQLYANVEAGTI
jgi:hypothetical protein